MDYVPLCDDITADWMNRIGRAPFLLGIYLWIFRVKSIGTNKSGLQLFVFRCKKHGVVIDYLHGKNGFLLCNECRKMTYIKSHHVQDC